MAEVQSFTVDLENKGLLLSRPGDVLPPGYLTNLLNLTANKTGFIESRRGITKINGTALPGPVHSQGRIIINQAAYIYQGSTTSLYRAFSLIATGFSGNPLVMRDGGPDLAIKPHILVFDSYQRMKDDGTTVTGFGIAGPMAAAGGNLNAALSKTIDQFDYANNGAFNAVWTPTDITLTTSATNPFSGAKCGALDIAGLVQGSMVSGITVDLSQFTTPGDSTDADFISIYFRVEDVGSLATCGKIDFYFDVDPTTNDFAHNYYYASADVTAFPPVVNAWNNIRIRKSAFSRSGSSVNNWANVKAIKLIVLMQDGTTTTSLMGLDQFTMVTGASLAVSQYEWIYRYKNQNTGSTSPFSPAMSSPVTVTAGSLSVTVNNPRDTQVTHIELYRRGGSNSIFEFVNSTVVTAWTGTTDIVDNYPDSALGDTTDLTQVEMANVQVTPSQCAIAVLKTVNDGGTYTDYTAACSDDNQATYAVLNALDTQANGDGVVIGADRPFRDILLKLDANVNTNTAAMTVKYFNGTGFVTASNISDGTTVAGKTLSVDGVVRYDFPDDWVPNNQNGLTCYHALIVVSAVLSATVHVTEVRVAANAFDPTVGEVFAGRVWADDSHHTDRLWYSERFAVEVFLEDNFIVGSTSGDPIVRPYGLDDQLFIFTSKSVDRLIGSGPATFQPIATGSEVGLFSKWAICRGVGRIFYRAYDGIYALPGSGFSEKISLAIDPLFHGIACGTEGELQPVSNSYSGTETMEFFDMKVRFGYTATNAIRYEIIYDLETQRWELSDRKTTSYLRLDDVGLIYSGESDGFVRQLETGNTDDGESIPIRFRTGYLDFGTPSQTKQFTEIVIDANCAGETLDFYADLNNSVSTPQYAALTNMVRGPLYFPLADDTQARNIALRLTSVNGGSLVKFFKVTFFYIVLPTPLTILPTDWNDEGYPGDKRFNQLQIEIDTGGVDVPVDVQVDGDTTETVIVNTASRMIVPISLAANTIGKLVRLIFRGTQGFRYYKHQFEFNKDPLQETRYDTYWLDFGYTRWKFIRRVWVAAQTPATVTMEIQIDGMSRFTATFSVAAGTGWLKSEILLPDGLKGKLFRFIFTTTEGMKIFMDQSDVEWHPLANERGYDRARLVSRE